MKILKLVFLIMMMLSYSGLMTSCGHSHDHSEQHNHDHDNDDDHSHEGDEDHDHDHDSHTEDDHNHDHVAEAAHGENAAFTSAYVCPMHCEGSGSDVTGKCPVCNMDYVAQVDHTKDGHSH